MKNPEFLNQVEKIASSNLSMAKKEEKLLKSCVNIIHSPKTDVAINDQD